MKTSKRAMKTVCKEAAYLVAAMHDDHLGGQPVQRNRELLDSLDALRGALETTKYLDPYRDGDKLRI